MAQPTQTRRILIKVDAPGVKDALDSIQKAMGGMNKNVKSLSGNMGFLTNAFRGWLGYLGVRELVRMSDEMQNIGNRLKIVTGSVEGAQEAFQAITGIADRTNQSLNTVGETYSRFGQALKGAKGSTEELSAFTETLINTFRVAGTSTAETSNTLIQLSQAFSSGKLSGDELRSVMEQNVVLAGMLRKEFGKDLAAKAKEGLITASVVMGVLAKNQREVNEQAKQLAPTFEQTLTKAMNKVQISIKTLNDDFQLSARFAMVVGVAVEHLSDILIVFGGVALARVLLMFPLLITQIKALGVAMLSFASKNPLVAALTAITIIGFEVYNNWDSLVRMGKLLKASIYEVAASLDEAAAKFVFGKIPQARIDSIEALRKSAKGLREEVAEADKNKSKLADPNADETDKRLASLIAKIKAMEGANKKVAKLKDQLAELNKQFLKDENVEAYFRKLESFDEGKLKREFQEGKMDLFKYSEGLRDLKIKELNRDLDAGKISMSQFNDAVDAEKFKVLEQQFKYGRISLSEYNNEVLKLESKLGAGSPLRAGLESYIKSIGTLGEGIAKGISQAFGHLEDNLFDFIKTGKFEFGKFTQAILDDLLKIIIRASIIKPFAEAILTGLGTGATAGATAGGSSVGASGGVTMAAANGAAFMGGNVIPFARGGIVDSPTGFTYGGGRRGVMGEAGPEAIIPLSRSGNGKLGVEASVTPVTVNIINQSGAGVQQTETTGPGGERQIDILISAKVRDGIVSGKYDTAMKSAYGVSRRGS